MVLVAAIGAANTLREIVKEFVFYVRERVGGFDFRVYFGFKMIVFGALMVVQLVIFVVIVMFRVGGFMIVVGLWFFLVELLVVIVLVGVLLCVFGLVILVLVSNLEKVMVFIVVIFIMQWLFFGGVVDL